MAPGQNSTLQFVKYIINCQKRSTETLITYNRNNKKSNHVGENDLDISKLYPQTLQKHCFILPEIIFQRYSVKKMFL